MRLLATALRRSDHVAGRLAHHTSTLAQLSLIALGVHLAADRLDDHAAAALISLQDTLATQLGPSLVSLCDRLGTDPAAALWWSHAPTQPPAAVLALAVELAVLAIFTEALLLTPPDSPPTAAAWWAQRSVLAAVLPSALLLSVLAGTWSIGMATADLLPPSGLASAAATLLAVAVFARLGLPAWARTTAHLTARTWRTGLKRALLLVPFGVLTAFDALPLRGVLS